MPKLRLGVHQLPAADAVLVQTLMRLYSHAENCQWSFAPAPPYDALLTSSEAADVEGMARLVLRLADDQAADAPDVMHRPIRADRLQQCLDEAARQLQAMPAATAPAPVPAIGGRDEKTPRFRLRQWPPVALLQDDPQRIRMATLLSRHAMSVEELAAASKQPVLACRRFLKDLNDSGLASDADASHPQGSAQPPERKLLTGIRQRLGF